VTIGDAAAISMTLSAPYVRPNVELGHQEAEIAHLILEKRTPAKPKAKRYQDVEEVRPRSVPQ
jgi:hypothetical protein